MYAAFLVYSTLLRFDDEIEHIWTQKFTLLSVFYVCALYGTLCLMVSLLTSQLFPEDVSISFISYPNYLYRLYKRLSGISPHNLFESYQ